MSSTPDDSLPPPMPEPVGVPPAAPSLSPHNETLLAQLVRDVLRERRLERRWRTTFRLFWLLLAGLFVYSLWLQGRHVAPTTTPHTALVEVRGEIAADTEASAELLLAALKDAFKDDAAQAVVLRINSPGGSPVQAGIVYDEIQRLKKLYDKPVYAVVEEMCASGAYYIAAAADEIYVDKASVVGSIGVLMDGFGFTGLMDKLGIERRLLTAGENKGMLDPFSPLVPKQRAYAQAMLDQIHQQFIHVVREGRGKRLKETPDLFSGLFWNGEQAVQLGLADHYGNLDYVAREVVKAEEVIDYTPRDNVAERLAKRFGASVGAGAVKALRELSPVR
ncbi:signal peptide peptidase SppA [Pelomonas cellulosilytica]|uniref:Signal peptide peptidase SppA n=1 Tax=Pelomonas cellulosilytica TaxID=2906762 RepID=A0ABS8Y3U2_9BURK|nr:signal peptide peptidase SppA [Pelomonas sp. P8]MCE4557896.1 signal peptide peptidase SppA [Pelomonas sp. P8]